MNNKVSSSQESNTSTTTTTLTSPPLPLSELDRLQSAPEVKRSPPRATVSPQSFSSSSSSSSLPSSSLASQWIFTTANSSDDTRFVGITYLAKCYDEKTRKCAELETVVSTLCEELALLHESDKNSTSREECPHCQAQIDRRKKSRIITCNVCHKEKRCVNQDTSQGRPRPGCAFFCDTCTNLVCTNCVQETKYTSSDGIDHFQCITCPPSSLYV